MTGKFRRKLKIVFWTTLAVLLFLLAILPLMPTHLTGRYLLPDRLSYYRISDMMVLIAEDLKNYRVSHDGKYPETFSDLRSYLLSRHKNEDDLPGFAAIEDLTSDRFQYHPDAKGDEPVVLSYISYADRRDIVVWTDANGKVYAAPVTKWPVSRLRK